MISICLNLVIHFCKMAFRFMHSYNNGKKKFPMNTKWHGFCRTQIIRPKMSNWRLIPVIGFYRDLATFNISQEGFHSAPAALIGQNVSCLFVEQSNWSPPPLLSPLSKRQLFSVARSSFRWRRARMESNSAPCSTDRTTSLSRLAWHRRQDYPLHPTYLHLGGRGWGA